MTNTGLVSRRAGLTSLGEDVSLALNGNPLTDGVTTKIPYGVDVYYTDQPCTLSFPFGLVKTEFDFTVRSVWTGLGK